MTSTRNRDDEIYEEGVHAGQQADAMDQFAHNLSKGYTLNPRENEIYNAGYAYGVAHKPRPTPARPAAPSEPRRADSSVSDSSGGASTPGSELLGKLIGVVLVAAAVIWFVFSVAVPLLVINAAAITLVAGAVKKSSRSPLFVLSVACAGLVIADYNNGWFTETLVESLAFFRAFIAFFLYGNVASGLVSAFFLVRGFVDGKNPRTSGAFSRRDATIAVGLLAIGALFVAVQQSRGPHSGIGGASAVRTGPQPEKPRPSPSEGPSPVRTAPAPLQQLVPPDGGPDLPDPSTAEQVLHAQIFGPKGASFQIVGFRKTNGQPSEMNGIKFYALDFSADVYVLEDVTYQHSSVSHTIQVFERGSTVGEPASRGDRFQILGTVRYKFKERGWTWLSSDNISFQLWSVLDELPDAVTQ